MLFVELRFFAFFAVVFTLYWMISDNNWRKRVLLAASYTFYAAWDWRFLSLILFVSAVAYLVGRAVEAWPEDHRRRKIALGAGIATTLAVLGVFKYFNFFTESFADLATLMGLSVNSVTLSIVLPVGISFYTFQAISYMVDVHREDIPVKRSFADVCFYIAFFPQLVAGPIVRAADFMPQMQTARRWADVNVKANLLLFLIGFIKKACISDNIAPYVDAIFAAPETYQATELVGGVFLYGVQIYCDFSGYSDMAIALAGLLGYRFLLNFDAPYLSPNIQTFWRRWHISLSTWLRDYLYIPLGGNRQGEVRRDVNLMITMLLGGLWHGASLNFVIWGFLHGLALLVHRNWEKLTARKPKDPVITQASFTAAIGTVMTVYWVHLAWIFFRAPDLEHSIMMAKTYLTLQGGGSETLPIAVWPFLIFLMLIHWGTRQVDVAGAIERLSANKFALVYGASAALALSFVPLGYRPFIYFQF
ncbi:MAG: MBOAT family O-acyltransferase [Pseudomonadota bacterium]